jgi:DNA-directed RNA polymerase specialized sigma24 family protein
LRQRVVDDGDAETFGQCGEKRALRSSLLPLQTELRSVLTSALEELPDHYRAVTILHDVEGWSMAAHRARLLLRQRLAGFMSGAPFGVEMAS